MNGVPLKVDYSKTLNEQYETIEYYKNRYKYYEITINNMLQEKQQLIVDVAKKLDAYNEFEKWLEKYKKDEMFDCGNEQANNDFNEFCKIALDKLQELKGKNNEKSND